MAGKLLVIICDRLSELVRKGEVTERYYNPGEVFDEVHLLLVNDDRPDAAAVQTMVGGARLHLHNLPAGDGTFLRTLAWRPALLHGWAEPAVALARQIGPALVRCHGAHLNGYAAYRIRKALGVPYIVSLHNLPGWPAPLKERLLSRAGTGMEKVALRAAERVLPVYRSIVPRLQRLGVTRYEVVYNAINPRHVREKQDYSLHAPARIVSVGRQIPGKDPSNIVRAVAALPQTHLTLVGDGPLHDRLRGLASASGAGGRVAFHRALPNDEICRLLPDFDIFSVHNDYDGISKAVLEALLTGMPVITNRRRGSPVPELEHGPVLTVPDTVRGYADALQLLATDAALRERLGRAARAHSLEQWAPESMESRVAAIYREVLSPAMPE